MRYEASFTACQKFLSIGKYDDQSGSSIAFHIEYETLSTQKVVFFDGDLVAIHDFKINHEIYNDALALCEWHKDTSKDDIKKFIDKLVISY